jgi:hypothetical protein
MLADNKRFSDWGREGGPLDIVAIVVAIIVIAGGFSIVYSRTAEYRSVPLVSVAPVMGPSLVPTDEALRQ